jgi:hypothetical protein
MNQDPSTREQEAVQSFRSWRNGKLLAGARLVHYAGMGEPSGKDVELSAVEAEITGCVAEGFKVAWKARGETVFVVVQEPDCSFPAWDYIFREAAAVDVDELLEQAGLGQ